MKKIKALNFIKKDNYNRYFIALLIILIVILFSQILSNYKKIVVLQEEIKIQKEVSKEVVIDEEIKESSLMSDTKKVYDLIGPSNVESINLDKNKVTIVGKCSDVEDINKLRKMKNINNFTVNSVEKQDDDYLFNVVYQIGGGD